MCTGIIPIMDLGAGQTPQVRLRSFIFFYWKGCLKDVPECKCMRAHRHGCIPCIQVSFMYQKLRLGPPDLFTQSDLFCSKSFPSHRFLDKDRQRGFLQAAVEIAVIERSKFLTAFSFRISPAAGCYAAL